MSIERKCENCAKESGCPECDCNKGNNYEEFAPNEKLVRSDERSKLITLLKSDLENYDGLADDCVERKDIHELLESNAVRKYIESTIELLEKEK